MNDNKNTIIWVTIIAAIAVLSFFSVGGFLLYNSYIKNKEMEVKLRLEQEKRKQEIAKSQSQQQLAQVTTASQETTTPFVNKRRTNYEAELMNRMSSVDESLPYKAYQTWDVELNKVYKLLMSEIPENSKIKLRNSERAWLKQMVNEVNRSLDESCGVDENGKRMMCGTSDSIDEANIKFRMTKERTIELARMYDELHK